MKKKTTKRKAREWELFVDCTGVYHEPQPLSTQHLLDIGILKMVRVREILPRKKPAKKGTKR